MIVLPYGNVSPKISKDCFVAQNATLVGDVVVGEKSSIWFGVSIRAEKGSVRIGERSNVQDNCVLHTDSKRSCVVGDGVSIGHGAIIHGATIGDGTLVGMGAILLNGSKIGRNCLVAAGSLVTEETEIADESLAMGSPARAVRKLADKEIERLRKNAREYDGLRVKYMAMHSAL